MIPESDRRHKALRAFIDTRRKTPFSWGKHDCCLFACDALKAIHGVDLAAGFRGTYSTAVGAGKVMLRMGARSVEDIADLHVAQGKLVSVPVKQANRGHLLVVRLNGQAHLGISIGEHGVFAGVKGLEYVLRCDCAKAYDLAGAPPVSYQRPAPTPKAAAPLSTNAAPAAASTKQ